MFAIQLLGEGSELGNGSYRIHVTLSSDARSYLSLLSIGKEYKISNTVIKLVSIQETMNGAILRIFIPEKQNEQENPPVKLSAFQIGVIGILSVVVKQIQITKIEKEINSLSDVSSLLTASPMLTLSIVIVILFLVWGLTRRKI